ncbi:hypothetical protein PENTCL1PPCAC_25885, partial [Pristionchus entomophagus]
SVSPLTLWQLEEGLLSKSEDGQPVATCVVSEEEGLVVTEQCPITPGFGPRSVACMSIWRGSLIIKRGCHSGQDVSLEDQCRKESCVSSDLSKPVNFCCCFGPLCNQKYAE